MKSKITINKSIFHFLVEITVLLTLALACFVGYKKFTGREYINYREESNLDYTICFKQPNNFYEQECIPKTINNYVTKYIDTISVNFNYKLNINKEIDSIYKYKIIGELTIFDRNNNSNIMNRRDYTFLEEKIIKDNSDEIKVNELIKFHYSKFNNFVNDYNNHSNVPAGANLKIIFHIESANKHSKVSEVIKTSNDIIINIPLGEPTIKLTTDYNMNNQSPNIEIQTNQTIINAILISLSFLSGTIGTGLLITIIIITNKNNKAKPIYERLIDGIKNDFDADITNLKNLIDVENKINYSYLDVISFKELYEEVKINNKQIYWNEKKHYDENGNIANRISWFFVFLEEKKIVRFIVDENILNEEYNKNSNIINVYRG